MIAIFIFPMHQKVTLIFMVILHVLNLILVHGIVAKFIDGNKKRVVDMYVFPFF